MMASLTTKHDETNQQQQQQQQQQHKQQQQKQQQKQHHSLMKEEEEDSRPFHLLMSEDVSRRRLDGKLQRDWLSKRHEIFAQIPSLQAETNDSSTQDPTKKLWSGASNVEKALISCCCCSCNTSVPVDAAAAADHHHHHRHHYYMSHSVTPSEDEDDPEEDSLVIGALLKSKIVHFLGTAACQAHDLSSRALVLAILERTHELDERIYHTYELACAELPTTTAAVATTTAAAAAAADEVVKKAPGAENNRNNNNNNNNHSGETISAASAGTIKPPPPRRLMKFLCAGGLRVLSRWLMEASEPVEQEVKIDASSPPSSQAAAPGTLKQPQRIGKTQCITKPSLTGPLLLPLLEFLARIPFNRQLITESKINKQIKNLSKEIDALVAQGPSPNSKTKRVEPWTDAVAGGYPVKTVQQAVNHLKQVWEEQAKLQKGKKNSTPVVTNPFDKVTKLLQERVKELEMYESARAAAASSSSSDQQQQAPQPPEWLAKALAKQPQKKRKLRQQQQQQQQKKPRETAQQMARRERENERAAFMKADLEKAQRERQELLRKLREMKNLKAVEDKKAEEASTSKRRVRWKDGMGPQSKIRKRDELEQVFVFIKDQDRLAVMEENVDGAAEAGEDDFADEDMFNTEEDDS